MSRPEDENSSEGSFLGRWSKRKQDVQLEIRQSKTAPVAQPSPLPAVPEAELPLPSLDDVLPGGDVSAFLQKHVPDSLRNLALRKAWLNDPEISGFIEMADYQWDFTKPDSIPGWSSTLEGIDVQAMVERVFNSIPPAKDIDSEATDIPPENASNEEAVLEDKSSEKSKTSHNIIQNAENEGLSPDYELKKSNPDYVALQNNTEISETYPFVKKRHGSALPT